jgi:lysophospholipase L1-like esterase
MTRTLLAVATVLIATAALAAEKSTVINAGVGGNNSRNLLARLDKDVLDHQPQLVVLMVGTNDVLNSRNSVPLNKYRKNLEKLIGRITRGRPKLILMTIPPCHEPYLLERHPAEFYAPDGPGGRIQKANRFICQAAKKHKIPLVDVHEILSTKGNIGERPESLLRNKANCGSADGVHPTPEGYQIIAAAVHRAIRENHLPADRVVCLGNSITFGAHVKGAGTSKGETYPAVLRRLLNASD